MAYTTDQLIKATGGNTTQSITAAAAKTLLGVGGNVDNNFTVDQTMTGIKGIAATTGSDPGDDLNVRGGAGHGSGAGGSLNLIGGYDGGGGGKGGNVFVSGAGSQSADGDGGDVIIDGGSQSGSGLNGVITIGTGSAESVTIGRSGKNIIAEGALVGGSSGLAVGGQTSSGAATGISISASSSSNSTGGPLALSAGTGTDAAAGDVTIQGGYGAGTGSAGNIYLSVQPPAGAGATGKIYLGSSTAAASSNTTTTTVATTGGSGSNVAGGHLAFHGGIGTGTAKGGNIKLQTSSSTSSGSTAQTLRDRLIIVAQGTALTDATATTLFTVNFSGTETAGGTLKVTVRVTDGTDVQSFSQTVNWAAVCKGTAVTATITAITSGDAKAVSAGTLTHAWTAVTGTSTVAFKLAADTSLTPSGTNAFVAYYTIENNSQASITLP